MAKYLVVEKDKVRNNIRLVREKAGDALIYGVLKGNGYGFGLIEMADLLRDGGVSRFAVTEVRDMIVLRNSGFVDEEILMLRSTALPEEIEKIIEYNAVATVGSYDTAIALNGIAEKKQTGIEAHIEIDTGMGRYGFSPKETDKVVSVFKYMSSLNISGMYTHFCRAFSSEKATRAQLDAFTGVADAVRAAGFSPGRLHSANSSALFKFPYTVQDAVRIGSAFTGRIAARGNFGLLKTGCAECEIIEIRWLEKGQTVGYGADYRARSNIRAAVVPIGYSDGFCADKQRDMFRLKDALYAGLSGAKGWISGRRLTGIVNGKSVPVIGHVGMAHTVLDVTKADCAVGDAVRFEINPLVAGSLLPRKYV